MTVTRFTLSPTFIDVLLKNSFGNISSRYDSTDIYFGLGITFDETTFTFTKEPVSAGFTILSTPITFTEPVAGIIRNQNAISWPKATQDWTEDGEQIAYLGLYYKLAEESDSESDSTTYELIGVLPLSPAETVKTNEQMVLNANSVQIKLSNK